MCGSTGLRSSGSAFFTEPVSWTLEESVLAAAELLHREVSGSDLHLLEFHRRNPNGHRFQALRDGVTSYVHPDTGELANSDRPIASLEVQGLAFDALNAAATLLADRAPKRARAWRRAAATVRAATLDRFWIGDESAFAMGVDRDVEGRPRIIRAFSSKAAELLETTFFDDLPNDQRRTYVAALVGLMNGSDFLTDGGVRCLAVRHGATLPYWDYQGSFVTWFTISNVFARGLRRQDLLDLACDHRRVRRHRAALRR
jgi:hypothetical protein